MTRLAAVLAGTLTLTLVAGSVSAASAAAATVPITVNGLKAGTQVDVTIEISGAGAPVSGAAGGNGMLDMLSDVGAGGKPHIQLTVHIGDQCVDAKVRIAMTQGGADPRTIPPECRRRTIGVFWLDTAQHLTISVANGTLTIDESAGMNVGSRSGKGMGTGTKIALIVGGGAAVAGGAIAAGGGSSKSTPAATSPTTPTATAPTVPSTPPTTAPTPTPSPTPTPAPPPSISTGGGNYVIVITVASDPNGHRMFVGYESVATIAILINGSGITISGPAPWVTVNGTIDLNNGRFTATGSGTVAGRNNVPVNVDGTLVLTETAALSPFVVQATTTMNIAVGGGGSLPGSADDGKIRYSATGRRQ